MNSIKSFGVNVLAMQFVHLSSFFLKNEVYIFIGAIFGTLKARMVTHSLEPILISFKLILSNACFTIIEKREYHAGGIILKLSQNNFLTGLLVVSTHALSFYNFVSMLITFWQS